MPSALTDFPIDRKVSAILGLKDAFRHQSTCRTLHGTKTVGDGSVGMPSKNSELMSEYKTLKWTKSDQSRRHFVFFICQRTLINHLLVSASRTIGQLDLRWNVYSWFYAALTGVFSKDENKNHLIADDWSKQFIARGHLIKTTVRSHVFMLARQKFDI